MDPFTKAFNEIDEDGDGIITRSDLENFVRKNDLGNDAMVDSWLRLFDGTQEQTITIQSYRDKLGLIDSSSSKTSQSGQIAEPDSEVRVITANMSQEIQCRIIAEVRRLTSGSIAFDEAEVVKDLKQWLQLNYDRAWHVMIVRGSYWLNYSHDRDFSFQFLLGKHGFLVWRTHEV